MDEGRWLARVRATSGVATLGTLPLSEKGKLAYFSRESGRSEVYVTSYPEVVGKWRVSADGGTQPRWRRDGKEIFYISRDAKLMAAEVSATSDSFEVGAVRPLFDIRPASTR